jgi:hypothetical protein
MEVDCFVMALVGLNLIIRWDGIEIHVTNILTLNS